nr:hypothetical protein [Shewanella jiangmenensis]
MAQTPTLTNPAISAVLDGFYQNGDRVLGGREEGFGLGESELAISANIDDMFYGKVTTVIEVHDGDTELELEEAFIQTLALPAGFSVRAGRFLSDIGYLNNQHLHTDAFADRPAAYRAFLGGHYFDDGVRLSWVAPTDLYWTFGVEALKGEKLRAADEHGEREFDTVGVYNAFTKIGGDIGDNSSWQLGLALMDNRNGRLTPYEEGEEGHDHGDDAHGHSHSAAYTGEKTYVADVVYKWAPDGNYKYQHLTLSGEFFRVEDFKAAMLHEEDHGEEEHDHEHDTAKDHHQGWYVSGVYQFNPNWSAGLRYGELETEEAHGDHFHAQDLKETELSLNYHHSHFSTVRLQYTRQQGTNFDGLNDDNLITLQYVMTLGAHGAHQF